VPRLLLLLLALVALFNLSRVLREPLPGPDRPMDFRTCYVGQAVLRQGHNPYADGQLKAGWRQLVQQEQLESHTQPGLPNLPFMYPPWAAALFGLSIGQLPYRWAWPLWYVVAAASLGAMCWLWARLLATELAVRLPWWQLLLAALALKGTVPALLTGQPTFLALALGAGALAAVRTNGGAGGLTTTRTLLAGLLLGLAAFKVTLLLPFVGWFLYRRRWKPLLVGGVVVALLSAVAWHWAADPAALLPTYQRLVAQVRAQSFDPADPDYPLTQGMTLRLELGNVLEWLWPGSSPWHWLLHVGLWGAAVAALWWRRGRGLRLSALHLFLLTSGLTLLTTYHLYYDAVLLLPLAGFALLLRPLAKWALLGLSLPFFIPLNGIAQALGSPSSLHGMYFLLPPALLGVLLVLLRAQPAPQASAAIQAA